MNGLATQTLTFIPVCCVCGLARENGDPAGSADESWSDFDAYLNRHGLRGAEYKLTHAYCPVCVHQYVPAKRKSATKAHSVHELAPAITTVIL